MALGVSRRRAIAFRARAQQLDRAPGSNDDCALLDAGVQDTGPDGARWALVARGADALAATPDALSLAWTLRGAPHAYRTHDLPAIAAATAPFSDADAAKRIFDANRPLKQAGIGTCDALRAVATEMRDIVRSPTVKGELSRQLTERMPEPYRRYCRPCDAVHLYEQPFRLAALQAGLRLQPGTSPPVLERIPGMRPPLFHHSDEPADPRFDVVRATLRFHGPTTPAMTAQVLDAPIREVKERWPDDAVEVRVEGEPAWVLEHDVDELAGAEPTDDVRLLSAFDPLLQARDRDLLLPDPAARAALWPRLGRPGAITVGGEIVATWRPRTSRGSLAVRVAPLRALTAGERAETQDWAERLAEFRGVTPGGAEFSD
ncbi:winged helix DNA-binding domain-containing protein [Rhodococcus rhodnii]|nr:crosslink repair DNA glycosylase YcaQ family protein [Rhodococcus rhodnii]TXG92861.1 winged helix DNA-binding domain-containing protein [Rhodococcus rhodnii]